MEEVARRVAVLLDEQPLWLDAMAELLRRVGIEPIGKTTRPTRALELVGEHDPDVFIASTRATRESWTPCRAFAVSRRNTRP